MTAAVDFLADGSIDYRSSRTYQQDPPENLIGNPFTTFNLGLYVRAQPDDRAAGLSEDLMRSGGRLRSLPPSFLTMTAATAPAFRTQAAACTCGAISADQSLDNSPGLPVPKM